IDTVPFNIFGCPPALNLPFTRRGEASGYTAVLSCELLVPQQPGQVVAAIGGQTVEALDERIIAEQLIDPFWTD
ncbi:MAG: hypothetical protein ACPGXI_16615, partial [Mycobacterium sp.]